MKALAAILLGLLVLAAPAAAEPIDIGLDTCLELVPQGPVAPSQQDATLSVRVLLDGVAEPRAQALFGEVQKAYAQLHVKLSTSYQQVTLKGNAYNGLISQAHALFGGRRPVGVDIVYTVTTKDLEDDSGSTSTAGFSDCIGGIAYADRGFAVGEDHGEDAGYPIVPPFSWDVGIPAEIAAHEIGHLLGAHHHYTNCAEGLLGEPVDLDPCTVMFPDVCCTSLAFGQLEAAVVRGHVEAYAGRAPTKWEDPQPQPQQQPSQPAQQPASGEKPASAEGSSSGSPKPAEPEAKSKPKSKPKAKPRKHKRHTAKKRRPKHRHAKHRHPKHKAQSNRS